MLSKETYEKIAIVPWKKEKNIENMRKDEEIEKKKNYICK
mgnify:CR=1 FL=1